MLASSSRARAPLVLFDFLAPRLYAASTKFKSKSLHHFAQTRCLSSSSNALGARVKPISLHNFGDTDYNEVNSALLKLRKAAAENDVETAWTSYGFLLDKGLRHLLAPTDYDPTSKMLVDICRQVKEDSPVHRLRDAVEGLALACAQAGSQDGLRQLMLYHLARDDPDSVLSLFDRFVQITPQHSVEGAQTVGEDSDILPSSTRFNSGSRFSTRYILIVTIAAYASKDAFAHALTLLLKYPEKRLVPSAIKLTLQGHGLPESLIERTTEYCRAASIACLVQRPEVFKAHVRNLSVERVAAGRLAGLAESMLSGFTGPLPWAALDESHLSSARPVVIPDKAWATLLKALISAREEQPAERLWVQLLDLGIVPSIELWNGLLEAYRGTAQRDKLLRTWALMKEEGIPPDCRSYNAIIAALADKANMANALSVFAEFKTALGNSAESILVYNTLVDIYLTGGNTGAALELFTQMKGNGPSPDIVTYNIFCKYHGRKNDLKAVAQLVHQMMDNGIQPDVFTFTTLLSTMLRLGVPNASERLLQVMESMGVEQNVATYSAIIDAQARTGTVDGIRSAWDVLQSMETMARAQPNEITYTSMLVNVHRSEQLDADLIASITSDIVCKMRKRKTRITRGMYHILMKTCLENPTEEALTFFRWYYSEMRRASIPFAHDTWYIILNGLLRRNQWAMASEMAEDMLGSGFEPAWGVAEMVKEIRRWRARQKR